MKKSSIMLISGTIVIFVLLISFVAIVRISANKLLVSGQDSKTALELSGTIEKRAYDFNDFSQLEFHDFWDVDIKYGDQEQIIITTDNSILDEIDIVKKGENLIFSYKKKYSFVNTTENDVKVEITMKSLSKVDISGFCNFYFSNFNIDDLEISCTGASNIEADNVKIEKLSLEVSGAANVELTRIDIENCYLDISGASNIQLNMTGGNLTGNISGASNVFYLGDVKEEKVDISGFAALNNG